MIEQSHFLIMFQRTLLLSLVLLSLGNRQGNAQIVPDQTLGSERSIINSVNPQRSQIDGGAVRGSNLFHSFQEFNVGERTSVYFYNPVGIENILSRVTGGNPSNIFGKLGVLGEANLFLINPNGIIFGPNASLDLRGSFFATTADSIRLGDNGEFSATQPDGNSLLTVHPSALWFNHLTPNSILNQSTANGVGLQVPTGEILGLIGGNIIIDGGILTAEQGRIELGSVGNRSNVQLNPTVTGLTLDYSEVNHFQDIQLNNRALVDVSGEGSGNIQVRGQQVSLSGGSGILANTFGSEAGGQLNIDAEHLILNEGSMISSAVLGEGLGANLEINAQQMTLTDGILTDVPFPGAFLTSEGQQITGIFSSVQPGATGSGGDLTVNTQSLTLSNGAQIKTITAGVGNSGTITVRASEIEAVGVLSDSAGGLRTDVFPGATGNGGDLNVEAERIILRDGGQISSGVFGAGDGGNVSVTATERFEASGTALGQSQFPQLSQLLELFNGQFPTGILTTVFLGATGDGGDLTVNTPRITLSHGGLIGTGTISATGNSGDLKLQAHEINILGTSPDEFFPSSVFTSVIFGATGKGGNLTVDTQTLNLRDGGQVRAGTSGIGDSGNITIRASDINLSGSSGDGQFPSSILADVENLSEIAPDGIGSGNGGNLLIESDRILLRDGGEISANTSGSGNAGNLLINATDIEADGIFFLNDSLSSVRGGIRVDVLPGATGNGGNLTINTERLTLRNGAEVSTNMFGTSLGGVLEVNAREIEAVGVSREFASGLISNVFAGSTGHGGSIIVNTDRLSLKDGALVTANVYGSGQGGDIEVNATEIEAIGSSVVQSTDLQFSQFIQFIGGRYPSGLLTTVVPDAAGEGGNITVNAERIILKDGAQISAGTFGAGNSGNLTVQATAEIEIRGISEVGFLPSSIFTSVVGGDATGNGGHGTIEAAQITLRDGGQIRAGTSGIGNSGNLTVRASEIELVGRAANGVFPSSILTSVEDFSIFAPGAIGSGDGGNLFVESDRITIQEGASISTSTFGSGQAGNLLIDADTIQLNTGGLIEASSFGAGQGGQIRINANHIEATGIAPDGEVPSSIVSQSVFTGDGGNLTINTESLTLRDGGLIQASVLGSGAGGTIEVNAAEITAIGGATGASSLPQVQALLQTLDNQYSSGLLTTVLPGGTGQGGDLTVNAQRITLQDGAQIGAGTFGAGNSGNLRVRANDIEISGAFPNDQLPSSFFTSVFLNESGRGGNLTVEAQNIRLQDGGQIRAGTSGQGHSGNITVRANDIELSGRSANGQLPSSIRASVEDLSEISLGRGEGDGGNVSIESNRILVQEGAEITASSFTEGAAGSVGINANLVQLDNGVISAETQTGDRGNMTVNAQQVNLRNNSSITTNAMEDATGGDITLNTQFLTARENSQITASAVAGQGGNIQINANGVFLDNTSLITASSELGVDGRVEVESLVDPSEAVVKLSPIVINLDTILAQTSCISDNQIAQGSSFVITGRGGLPPNPRQQLRSIRGIVEWEPATQPTQETGSIPTSVVVVRRQVREMTQVQQAQGWVRTPEGTMILTAEPTTVQPQNLAFVPPNCLP